MGDSRRYRVVATSRWHLTGVLLLLIFGVAVVALAFTGRPVVMGASEG